MELPKTLAGYGLILLFSAGLGWLLLDRNADVPAAMPLSVPRESQEPRRELETRPTRAVDGGAAPLPQAEFSGLCPDSMLLVLGEYCARFRKGDDLAHPAGCAVTPRSLRFCIDRFEYPNLEGVRPATMSHYRQAKRACRVESKRLCTDTEWSFACGGPTRSEPDVPDCNIGLSAEGPSGAELRNPLRIEQLTDEHETRRPNASGACQGAFGAMNMLGNVQEWVASDRGYPAALKGGHARTRAASCRSSVNVKDLNSRYLHTGFRCCADALAGSTH